MVRQSLRFLGLWVAVVPMAWAATVDLADKPLASGTSGEVKPNVMIVLDDSGSMAWTHLPDHVRDLRSKVGYRSAQCNGIYYNPAVTYAPPVKADGTSYPDADFYKAPYDGFDSSSSKVDLSKSFRAYDNTTSYSGGNDTAQAAYYYTYSGTQPAMSYVYKNNGDVDTSTTFYKECNESITGKFKKVAVEGQGAAERQNFANWYSYYRIRLLTAKTAVGRALGNLSEPSQYRIGFTTHSYEGVDTKHDEFQKIDDFCSADLGCDQRTQIFEKLYGASANGGTPLRAALSKVGNIFAGKKGDDPVQYSCQQNFTILTTDGFWNGGAGYKIDGGAIGNQDGAAARPMWDGAASEKIETYRRYEYSTSTSRCSKNERTVLRQEQRQEVRTPIGSGSPSTGKWVDNGSATRVASCSKDWSDLIPDPNPTVAELLSTTTTTKGGTSNSLSDVSMYYYETDLRTPALGNCTGTKVDGKTYDVCENNVPGSGTDTASHQHMTTFTLGLGVDGSLKYCENYDSGGCADFEAIKQGTKDWPDPMDDEDLHRVDDLWHAAVNGRGKYFSAKSPESLAKGIQKALSGVSARTASAAAAATSNLEPVAGDNYAYVAMYTTVDWDGEIAAREIDLSVGTVSESGIWSARARIDSKVSAASDTRKIYFNAGGALKPFTAANLASQIAANYFTPGPANPGGQLTQYPELTAGEQTSATPASVIDFIRGQTQHEDESANTWKLYRDRKHALGDIVNAAPVYVRKPPFTYSDDNYSKFAENNKTRQSVVYAGANDGMLHAFDGDTGDELWAFIPTAVMPQLYKLADKSYSTNHRFLVDGPLTVGDVCESASCNANQWKTILVGGLGKGGRSYYALDVTNPTAPKMLWEFTDDNLGHSFGNAIITKRGGQWVVIIASGYNNVSPGDGKGRLFVLKASDGSKLAEIVTDNTLTDPSRSGIAKINNWVNETMIDNSTQHVYGGDLEGNVWRFDIVAGTATKITTIGKGDVPTQPITTKPELAEVKIGGTPTRVILVGSGKYLGTSDVGSSDRMSLYAIKDDLVSAPYGNFRTHASVVVQDLSGDSGSRQISYTAMTPDKIGWYMDFDVKNGERVNVDPKFQMGWWVVPSNIPDPNVCNIGGTSWLYFVDPWPAKTRVSDDGLIVNVGNALIVGINIVKLPNGKTVTIVTTSDAKYPVFGNPMAPLATKVRRLYWRELTR